MKCRKCVRWTPNTIDHDPTNVSKKCRLLGVDTDDDFGCDRYLGADSKELNVPQMASQGIDMPPSIEPAGKTHILIVSYHKDLPWLEHCLRSLVKNAKGFSGITVAHPRHHREMFRAFLAPFGAESWDYDEVRGKGMIQHMAKMAKADQFLPGDTQFVLHMDSDCVMHAETTPEHYIIGGRPHYLWRTYDSLINGDRSAPEYPLLVGCHQWKAPTEVQLGFKTDAYTMTRHPTVFPIDFYAKYRAHIEGVHRMDYEQWILRGRNDFPQDKMDLTAMGAYAFHHMHDRFNWINVEEEPYPKNRLTQFWSKDPNGLTPKTLSEINRLIG